MFKVFIFVLSLVSLPALAETISIVSQSGAQIATVSCSSYEGIALVKAALTNALVKEIKIDEQGAEFAFDLPGSANAINKLLIQKGSTCKVTAQY